MFFWCSCVFVVQMNDVLLMPFRNKRSQALKRRHAKRKADLLKPQRENPPVIISSVLQVNVVRLPDKLVKKLLEESS
ncbi:unnamed protein product [Arctogadus glacialis]